MPHLLADVLVLVKAFFSNMTFLQVDTQLEIKLHNRLVDLLPCSVSLTLNDIIEHI